MNSKKSSNCLPTVNSKSSISSPKGYFYNLSDFSIAGSPLVCITSPSSAINSRRFLCVSFRACSFEFFAWYSRQYAWFVSPACPVFFSFALFLFVFLSSMIAYWHSCTLRRHCQRHRCRLLSLPLSFVSFFFLRLSPPPTKLQILGNTPTSFLSCLRFSFLLSLPLLCFLVSKTKQKHTKLLVFHNWLNIINIKSNSLFFLFFPESPVYSSLHSTYRTETPACRTTPSSTPLIHSSTTKPNQNNWMTKLSNAPLTYLISFPFVSSGITFLLVNFFHGIATIFNSATPQLAITRRGALWSSSYHLHYSLLTINNSLSTIRLIPLNLYLCRHLISLWPCITYLGISNPGPDLQPNLCLTWTELEKWKSLFPVFFILVRRPSPDAPTRIYPRIAIKTIRKSKQLDTINDNSQSKYNNHHRNPNSTP